MKKTLKVFLKIIRIAFILFVFSFLFFGLSSIFDNGTNYSSAAKLGSVLPAFFYLFLTLFWIFLLTVFLFHFLTLKLRLQKGKMYLSGIILSLVVGLFSFNFGHLLDRDYSSMSFGFFLLLFFVTLGLLMPYLYNRYFSERKKDAIKSK